MARRPAIPPAFHALVGVLVAERSMLGEGVPWLGGWAGRVTAGIVVALLLACAFLRGSRASLALMAVALACSWFLSSLCLTALEHLATALSSTPVSSWAFVVQGDPSLGERGYRVRATAHHEGASAGDVWLLTDEPYDAGSSLTCVGRFSALGDDSWSASSRMQGICGTVKVMRVRQVVPARGFAGAIGSLRHAVVDSFAPSSSRGRALLAGCVCGWRDELRRQGVDKLFSRCGTAHLVAVSGGHLAILVQLVEAMLCGLGLSRGKRTPAIVAIGGLFALFCGAPVSALRSWAMSVVALSGALVGRRSHSLSAVCVVGLCMALLDPTVSGRVSFVLSVMSVAGLCLFSAYAGYVLEVLWPSISLPRAVPFALRALWKSVITGLRESVATSLVALVVTLPLVATTFGEVSLVGPLANALVSAPFTLMVGMGIVAGALCWAPAIRAMVLVVCDVLAEVVLRILDAVDGLGMAPLRVGEGSALPGISIVLICSLLVFWPRVSRKAAWGVLATASCILAVSFVRWRLFAPARICVLDVGQGDAILVQDGASAVLVDTGPDDSVVDALAREHVRHLDAVIVTHLHADHYAGIAKMVGRVPCDQVLVARGVARHVDGELARAVGAYVGNRLGEVAYGDTMRVGGFGLEVVSPAGVVEGDENADSIMLLVRYDADGARLTALLTGDAERTELEAAIARDDLCDLDVLKVGHHGSEVSLTEEQARELDPEVAVASAGEGNSYGHPRKECVNALETSGSRFLCTKDVGDVELRPGTKGPMVLTQR